VINPVDIAAFQRLRVGPDGARLLADGNLGPRTQWALDIDALPGWRQDIVLMGLRHVGVKETSRNRGHEIDAWLRACKVDPEDNIDDPWCAAFASMCLRAGGIEAREASVARLAAMFTRTFAPLPGDLCCKHYETGKGHVDIVTGYGPLVVSVVGGNVGDRVRAGLREKAGRMFYRVGKTGMPLALDIPTLPLLGAADR
jgi:uncharacterized protein (TIGR02594 family)